MTEAQSWFRQPRYSPLNLIVLLAVSIAIMSVGSYWVLSSWGREMSTRWEARKRAVIDATLVSPLPAVVLAPDENPHPQGRTFRKNYAFSQDYVTRYLLLWRKAFAPYKAKPDVNYLEIGAFEGGSIVWMLENILTDPSARVTAIDPLDGAYKQRYFANIELSGSAEKVTTLAGFSQVVLRTLPPNSYDLIYVDGSHLKCDTLEDAVLSWRLLKVGGLLVFDDYHIAERSYGYGTPGRDAELWCPKLAIDPFVQCFESKCEVLHNGEQLIIRKTKE